MKAEEMFALGRAYLRKKAPYLATTIYGLVPEAVKGCGTMAVTSGMVMYYDPDWVENEPEFQTTDINGAYDGYKCIAACIHHECQHVVRGLERVEALPDKKLANIAADMAVNYNLRVAGWKLPKWVIYPETCGFPEGKTMEEYYKLLSRQKNSALKKIQQKLEDSGVLERMGGQNGQGGEQQQDVEGKSSFSSTAPMAGQCGGIAGNAKDEALEQELDERVGRPKSDIERIKRVTAHEIQEHIKANGRGSTPGFSAESLKFEAKKSTVDWRRHLSRVVRRTIGAIIAGGNDFSIRRPSKRSMVLGVIRPGLIDQLCEVAFIRDTSGSMGAKDLNDANNEAIAVMQQIGIDEVWFMDADVKVHSCKRMRLKDIPAAKALGRGGTDFRQALQRAATLRPRPDVVIYLTDGDGTAPKKKPPVFEVIWCIVPSAGTKKPAKWGHIVLCSKDQKAYDSGTPISYGTRG